MTTYNKDLSANRFNEITYMIENAGRAANYSRASRDAVMAYLPAGERRAYESMSAAMDRRDAASSDSRGTY